MTSTGILALVLGLVIISFVFWRLQNNKKLTAKTDKEEKEVEPPKSVAQKVMDTPSVISTNGSNKNEDNAQFAAISLALHLYLNDHAHDVESNVITIKRIQRRYSPWSSKIYSMNNFQ